MTGSALLFLTGGAALVGLPAAALADPLFAASYLVFDTGNNPGCVAMGDLNGDGRIDLVVANSGANSVSVLLGNGGGTYGQRSDFPTASFPRSVAIGDLNNDG
ncbi:MAG TPA: VCBS repeat-containing protein, partial [Candidatus Eisenbacteria bacterium]|nr:VCBS repeat-containing protein [Candidatus Eisenbacteria bacterium]